MDSQSRFTRSAAMTLFGLVLALQPTLFANAETAPAAVASIMCPGGSPMATALAPYEALDKQRARIERALATAEGSIQMFEQLKADHLSGQRIWGFFQATDASVEAITVLLQTVKTKANLIRDLGADLDPTQAIRALAAISSSIEKEIQSVRGQEWNCELPDGSPGEKALLDFGLDVVPVAGTVNKLGKNVCETVENQARHVELVRTHRRVMAMLESELAKLGERVGALRSQLASVESKRRGLERQCIAFTEEKKKALDSRLAEFAMADAERSRRTAALRSSSESGNGGPNCAYNRERFQMYVNACASYDGCANRGQMEALVSQSCR